MNLEATTILTSVSAITLGFFIQSIAGFAGSLIAIPILLLIFNIQEANALLAPFYMLFSMIFVYKTWNQIDKKAVVELLGGTILGLVAGVYLLKSIDSEILKKVLGAFIIIYVLYFSFTKGRLKFLDKFGTIMGLLGGILSGLFAAGGNAYTVYLHNRIES